MRPSITATFLILTAANQAAAQVVQARYDSSCGLLSNKVYCYGGLTTADGTVSDVSMVMLDIFNNSGSTADEMKDRWVTVTTNTNGVDLNSRDLPQVMLLPDGKTLLLSGGWNTASTRLTSQTIAYSADTNSWNAYANYVEVPFGNRQICQASSVYVPNLGVGFFGGIETDYDNNWFYPGINITAHEDNKLRYIGYTSLTFFDIGNLSNPWSTFPIQINKPIYFSAYQTSIFDAKSNRIFFFGGSRLNPVTFIYEEFTFASSLIFDLTKGEWGVQAFFGNSPSPRTGHSTNLVGPNQRDVLLYGGEGSFNNHRALLDYCFILNLDTYQWKQQSFTTTNTALVRTQHSAVSVNKETIFIVFGKDSANEPTLSLVMLNVTNPSNTTLIEKYVDPNAIAFPSASTSNIKQENTKLSTGATVGIAVGASAAGIIAIVAIFLYIIKKKKNGKKQQDFVESEIQQNDHLEEPVMEVNWDEIDKKYVEVATNPVSKYRSSSHFTYSPRLADESTTFTEGSTITNSTSPVLPNHNTIAQRPDAIDEISSYNVNHDTGLQKPDGA